MDYTAEPVISNNLYVVYFDKNVVYSDDLKDIHSSILSQLPEGSKLLLLAKDLNLKELSLEEAVCLRDALDEFIENRDK